MVLVHIAEGTEEIECITIIDILRRSSVDASSVSISGNRRVTGAHGIEIVADFTFDEADYESCDMLVFPGGMPGTINMKGDDRVIDRIRQADEKGKYIGAICAAPMILEKAGILKGRKACIYPGMEASISSAALSYERVVRDGKIITSRGPGTAMEFALELAIALGNEKEAENVRKGLVMKDV